MQTLADYSIIERDQDGVEVLKLIRGICHLRDDAKEGVMAMVQSDKRLFIFFQRTNQKKIGISEGVQGASGNY